MTPLKESNVIWMGKRSQNLISAYITKSLLKRKDLACRLRIHQLEINMTPLRGQILIVLCKTSADQFFRRLFLKKYLWTILGGFFAKGVGIIRTVMIMVTVKFIETVEYIRADKIIETVDNIDTVKNFKIIETIENIRILDIPNIIESLDISNSHDILDDLDIYDTPIVNELY